MPATDASTRSGLALDQVATPSLLLDLDRLEANIERLDRRADELDVDLRPHVKTAKCAEVAERSTAAHSGAITVSTLREAAFFLEHGFREMIYAVSVAPAKLDRATALRQRGAELKLLVDNRPAAEAVADAGAGRSDAVETLIEVDCDGTRGGVDPEGKRLLELARLLDECEGAELAGVLTHAGSSYAARSDEELLAAAERERDAVVTAAERLREDGHEVDVVSVGSTPTALAAEDLTGVTEMRPGNYVFFDLYQAGLGVCEVSDVAVTVLATVIGHRDRDGAPIVDAGSLALSEDRSTAAYDDERDVAYGLVADVDGRPLADGDAVVAETSQEHGIVDRRDGDPPTLEVGDRVRVYPNHSCIMAARYEEYHVAEDGDVTDIWARCNGW